MWLTCFQAAPVNLFEEHLTLQHIAVVVFEPQAFGWVLFHQTLTDVLALFGELRGVGNCVVNDPASYLSILNLDEIKWKQHFHHMKDGRQS